MPALPPISVDKEELLNDAKYIFEQRINPLYDSATDWQVCMLEVQRVGLDEKGFLHIQRLVFLPKGHPGEDIRFVRQRLEHSLLGKVNEMVEVWIRDQVIDTGFVTK